VKHQEVDRNSHNHHQYGRKPFAHAQPKKDIQQANLHKIVDNMTPHKARSIGLCGLFVEGKISSEYIVAHQSHPIACRVGNIRIGKHQEQAINAIMNQRTERTY